MMGFLNRGDNTSNTSNSSNNNKQKFGLYVQNVIDFSSQYGKEHSKSYTVANIRSMPIHYPRYGDFLESCVLRTYGPWWSRPMIPSQINVPTLGETLFISEDFIEVSYEKKIVIESVCVYETYHPGACVAIYAFDVYSLKWTLLWSIFHEYKKNREARNRDYPPKSSRKFMPNLIKKDVYSDKIRVEFEHSKLEYYTELDAIQIFGYAYEDINSIGTNLRNLSDYFDKIKIIELNNQINETNLAIIPQEDSSFKESPNSYNNNARRRSSQFSSSHLLQHNLIITKCSNLTEMPSEIISIILKYLDLKTIFRLRSTCKLFYELCSDESLFKILNLKPYWYLLDDRFMSLIKELTNDIRMLDLSWTKFESNEIIQEFFQISCQNLTTLKLDNCNFINGKMIKLIATNCTNIKELSLSSCNFKDVEGLAQIKHLKNLTNLNLYRTLIQYAQLSEILVECKQLRHLNLGSCTEIDDFEPIMSLIGQNVPEIESLDLWRAYGLTHDGLAKLANTCFNLKYLDLGWCRRIQNFECIRTLIANNRNLKKLFLTSLRISDAELLSLCRSCPQLEQLDILGSNLISLEAVEMVLNECKLLKLFDISFCANIDLQNFVRLSQIYTNCSIKKSTQTE